MNADQQIKAAQRRNDRAVLAHIRKHGPIPVIRPGRSPAWRNAIDRLEQRGAIKHQRSIGAYRLVRR